MTAGIVRPMIGRDSRYFWDGTVLRDQRIQN